MSRRRIFTPEKQKLVRVLVLQRFTLMEIANEVGVTKNSLKTLCSRHGVKLSADTSISASVSPSCYDSLLEEAVRMNMTVPRITSLILEVVAKDHLFEALSLEPTNQANQGI